MDEETRVNLDQGATERVDSLPTGLPSIPGFRLIRRIGKGGMGEVFEASQLEPVRRRVAIKLIRPGLDDDDVIPRFELERQALALMNHPFIARVFDAGTSPDGRPYFVMEFVEGQPIDSYCDDERLTAQERLELFLSVCDGVQHAHHRGVIHRDLKPANILVTRRDGKAEPKIIDFGIARAANPQLASDSPSTMVGDLLGTPDYMSPEQADMSTLDIDTRTDVFSLGVVLYELLVGARPFDARTLRKKGFDEMRRMIREEEPPRPSTRFAALGEGSTLSARLRHMEPRALMKILRGDLDWITMKALEKKRERRYNSPSDLAEDIRRHLRCEPILAHPPSVPYKISRFVRRNTLAFTAVLLIVFALVAGVAGITMGLIRARKAEQKADLEAKTAAQVSDFLIGLFRVSNPEETLGESITAREILDRGVESIENELSDQPVVQARLMHTMGTVYKSLGLYGRAQELFEDSVALREKVLPEDHPDTATSLNSLGLLLDAQGNYSEAETLFRRALEIRKKAYGESSSEVAFVFNNIALVYWHMGRYEEAAPLYERALAIWEDQQDEDNISLVLANLGALHYKTGDFAEAEASFARILASEEKKLGPKHPKIASALTNLATVKFTLADYEETERLLKRALAIREEVLGADHPEYAAALRNLAVFYKKIKQLDQVEPLLERALKIQSEALGWDHPATASTISSLANLYNEMEDFQRAEEFHRKSIASREQSLGPEHPDLARDLRNLAVCFIKQQKFDEAYPVLRRALTIQERAYGGEHYEIAETLRTMASLHVSRHENELARPLLERALEILRSTLKPGHPDLESVSREYQELLDKQ